MPNPWRSVYVKFFDGTNHKLLLSQVLADRGADQLMLRHDLGALKRVSFVLTPERSGYKVFAVLFAGNIA